MASITRDAHQPPKSPFWIACFNGVASDGRVRRLKRSTKTTDRKLAQRLADEWEQLEKLAGRGRTAALPYRSRASMRMDREQKNETELRTYWKYRQTVDEFLAHVGVKADRIFAPGATH